ncbi:MAG: Crp/Fnr family transcriptional regulator [Rhodoferax sp.]
MQHKTDAFDIDRYLAVMPLFSDLDAAERTRLAQGCYVRRYTRGDMVFRIGDVCTAFYVVVVGQVKLFVTAPNGQEKVVEIMGPGRSFAEAMMFLDKPYVVNVQALVDTMLLCVDKKTVFSEIAQDPQFALRMLAGISRRLHGLIMDVEGYSLQSGMQRLIGFLLRDVEDPNARTLTVTLPVSKAIVASRLSLTPEYFSRVLHELEDAGLIAIDKRDIHILDVQRLAHYGAR